MRYIIRLLRVILPYRFLNLIHSKYPPTWVMTSKKLFDLSNVRTKYEEEATAFLEDSLVSRDDPMLQLHAWLQEVRDSGLTEPNAMTLATCTRYRSTVSNALILNTRLKTFQKKWYQIIYSNYDSTYE